jgi:cyclopropane-fatty-acyl-phospholipid synthase
MNTTTAPPLAGLARAGAPAAARTACNCCSACSTAPHGAAARRRCSTSGPGGGLGAPSHAASNWNVCSAALKSGDIGFAESYIAGDWTTPHLTDLLKLFIANRQRGGRT